LNKHVPQPPLDSGDANSAKKTAKQGGEADIKELPPAKPAQAKSPTPQQPLEKPQADKPQSNEAEARKLESPTSETKPLLRKFWTRDRLTLGAILGAIVVGVILWWSWGGGGSKTVYAFTKAAYGTVTVSVRAAGTLAAHDSLDIMAPVGGRVQSVAVKSGDRVMKGQLLARLDSASARDEVLRAQTQIAAMQARVAQADADVDEARATVLRAKNEPKPGAYDTAQANLARALARASELQAGLREAQAQLTAARGVIGSLEVRAPIDGVVLKSDIEPGKYVSAAVGGRALFTLTSGLSQLKLVADIPESQLGGVHVGEPAQFTVPAAPRQVFPAMLTALELWPKKETKEEKEIITYSATLTTDNPDDTLRPGMSANVDIITAQARNVLVVPNQALTFSPPPDIESKYPKLTPSGAGQRVGRVWVLNGDTPEPREVTLGLTDGRITQIKAGPLRVGEKTITSTIQ